MIERLIHIALALCVAIAGGRGVAADEHTDQGCSAFTWDVTPVLEVLRGAPRVLEAGADAGALEPGEHYSLRLAPQSEVKFAMTPTRSARSASPRAGVFRFRIPETGRYRVSLSTRHWIDVVAGSANIDSADHQGRSGCERVHKIVEFELTVGVEYTLQLSGQDDAVVDLTITRA